MEEKTDDLQLLVKTVKEYLNYLDADTETMFEERKEDLQRLRKIVETGEVRLFGGRVDLEGVFRNLGRLVVLIVKERDRIAPVRLADVTEAALKTQQKLGLDARSSFLVNMAATCINWEMQMSPKDRESFSAMFAGGLNPLPPKEGASGKGNGEGTL